MSREGLHESTDPLSSPLALQKALLQQHYLADDGLSTVAFLSIEMSRPLFLEGEPGAGKTELARALSMVTGGELIRLQCYEGIDVAQALYEWDYSRQLLHLRASEARGKEAATTVEDEIYTERFLVRRPLLRALAAAPGEARPVLLIDEIDRADDEFEALLLELLSEYAVTIPELGTIRATTRPIVVLTSNRTRDVHDALKRRSLYHWVEHPDFEREVAIVMTRLPNVAVSLVRQVTAAVQAMRELALYKPPGVAETIDWTESLALLGRRALDAKVAEETLGVVLKYREDADLVRREGLVELERRAAARMTGAISDDAALDSHVAASFAAALRHFGLRAPLSSVLAFAEAIATIGLASEGPVYWAGRAIFVHGPGDVAAYNTAFYAYWSTKPDEAGRERTPIIVLAPTPSDVAPSDDDAGGPDLQAAGTSFSAAERLFHADLASLTDEELSETMTMLATMKRARDLRTSRRLGPGRSGRLDLRRSVASAVKRDGEIIGEHHLQRRQRERRIVVLCDVSGSMEPYSRAMLRLAHVLAQGAAPIEVFAMGTRLTRLTRRLATRDADLAMRGATDAIPDYSGGTRLGEALAEFNTLFGVRGAARGATVVICSDGIDRGDPELVAAEMARLARVAHRIIWVNPLAASPGYQPLARGMAAAMPFIDRFLPGDTAGALDTVLRSITEASRRDLSYSSTA